MATYNNKYVVMLDDWLEVFPEQFPISVARNTLDEARLVAQVTGNPRLVPRTLYEAGFKENKSVRDAKTGTLMKGGIYLLVDS